MANDRTEEAWKLIQKAAQINGKPLIKDLVQVNSVSYT